MGYSSRERKGILWLAALSAVLIACAFMVRRHNAASVTPLPDTALPYYQKVGDAPSLAPDSVMEAPKSSKQKSGKKKRSAGTRNRRKQAPPTPRQILRDTVSPR